MKEVEPPESEGETNRKKRKEKEEVGEGGITQERVAQEERERETDRQRERETNSLIKARLIELSEDEDTKTILYLEHAKHRSLPPSPTSAPPPPTSTSPLSHRNPHPLPTDDLQMFPSAPEGRGRVT